MKLNLFTKINLFVIILWFVSYLAVFWGLPKLLLWIPGTLLVFTLGFNLICLVENQTQKPIRHIEKILISLSTTPIIVGFIVYLSSVLFQNKISQLAVISSIIIAHVLVILILLLSKYHLQFSLNIEVLKNKNNLLLLAKIVLVALVLIAINMIVYPYLPEIDSYFYLTDLEKFISDNSIPNPLWKVLFYTYIIGVHSISNIPLYYIFKIFTPLLVMIGLTLPLFLLAKQYLQKTLLIFFSSLSALFFPVVIMEALYTRPQSLFMLFFAGCLYFCHRAVNNKISPFILIYLLILSTIGIKIHEFFMFTNLILIYSLIITKWNLIKKRPLHSIVIALILSILLYPWLRDMGVTNSIEAFAKPFWEILKKPTFNLWFIDSYVNTDGHQMGWPGYLSILYYGYNIGLVLPVIAIFTIINKIKIEFRQLNVFLFSFCLFFLIAEIFPRLGLAFLPDRAWLFIAMALSLSLPYLTSKIISKEKPFTKLVLIVLIISSFSISTAVTYLKQGWVTRAEVKSADYIKENLPEKSIIITQPGNYALVNYFAKRTMIVPGQEFFLENNRDYQQGYIDQIPTLIESKEINEEKIRQNLYDIQMNFDRIKKDALEDDFKTYEYLSEFEIKIKEIGNLNTRMHKSPTAADIENRPIYVLYSKDKFNSFYGLREWWKQSNFYEGNADDLSNLNMNKLYDQNGIVLWGPKK